MQFKLICPLWRLSSCSFNSTLIYREIQRVNAFAIYTELEFAHLQIGHHHQQQKSNRNHCNFLRHRGHNNPTIHIRRRPSLILAQPFISHTAALKCWIPLNVVRGQELSEPQQWAYSFLPTACTSSEPALCLQSTISTIIMPPVLIHWWHCYQIMKLLYQS